MGENFNFDDDELSRLLNKYGTGSSSASGSSSGSSNSSSSGSTTGSSSSSSSRTSSDSIKTASQMFTRVKDPMIDEDLDEDISQYETIGESSTFRTTNTKSATEKTRSEYREETIEEIKSHFERPASKPAPEPEKKTPEPERKAPEPEKKAPEPTPAVHEPEVKKPTTGSIQMKSSSSNNTIHSRRFPDSKPHTEEPVQKQDSKPSLKMSNKSEKKESIKFGKKQDNTFGLKQDNKFGKKTDSKPTVKEEPKSDFKDEGDDFWQNVDDEPKAPEKPTVKGPKINESYGPGHVMSRGEIMKHRATKQDRVKAEKARKQYRRINTVLNILLILFIVVFLGSAGYLIRYYLKVRKAESGFTTLRDELPDSEASVEEIEKEFSPEEIIEDEETGLHYVDINGTQVQMKFVHLYRLNDHFIGWLNIPDTVIDYPVMYTPFEEEYYLHKDYDKEYSASGTLFVAAKDDPIKPSDNVIIYGHNMKAGTMFHGLLEYESEDFYKNHKTFTFDTIEGNYTYEVIAAFRTKISENDFKYYSYIDFEDEAQFNSYLAQCKTLTPYIIEESALYGDKLLTLSTCAYHADEGRFVVVAKRIENADDSEDTTEE